MKIILPYVPMKVTKFCAYDPEFPELGRLLGDAVQKVEPRLHIEHVGSTSVPDCGGKGTIDLAVLYPTGLLARARDVLDGLGFQKQGGPEPFPEERPMRIGCVKHKRRCYRIHAHVIELDGEEHHELVWFRDLLRRDPVLRRSYEDRKREILALGIDASLEYCKAKGGFVSETLKARSANSQ